MLGGLSSSRYTSVYTSDVQQYNIVTNHWKNAPALRQISTQQGGVMANFTACVCKERIYCFDTRLIGDLVTRPDFQWLDARRQTMGEEGL